jgi:hypothetical protein
MTILQNDEILIANPITPSPSMVGKNMHGHHLKLLTRDADKLLVLVITFPLRPEAEAVRPTV